MHAECLAELAGVEAGTYIQSYVLRIAKPNLKCIELLEPEAHEEMLPMQVVTDCDDLHCALVSPAFPNPTNKQLSLYLACLREYKTVGRISAFIWCDTRDMLANALTKLEESGLVPLEIMPESLKTNRWILQHPYKYNTTLSSD